MGSIYEQSVKLQVKGTANKHCTLIKLFHMGVQVKNSEATLYHMYRIIIQSGKWMTDGGRQVSYYWSESLQRSKRGQLE